MTVCQPESVGPTNRGLQDIIEALKNQMRRTSSFSQAPSAPNVDCTRPELRSAIRKLKYFAIQGSENEKDQFEGLKTQEPTSRERDIIIDRHFTAANMRENCQVDVEFTYYLEQHLTMRSRRGKRTLMVYPLSSCLQAHKTRCHHSNSARNHDTTNCDFSDVELIPMKVHGETIKTLCLLFPWTDDTGRLITNHHQNLTNLYPFEFDNSFESPAIPLSDFTTWRHRLSLLYLEYSLPGPLWYDKRNRRDWLNF